MHKNLFGFIWHYSKTQQITALLFTVVSFPFLYLSFDLPKTIINRAIPGNSGGSGSSEQMDIELFGYNFSELLGFQMAQIPYLFLLCVVLLVLIIINGAFKMRINTYKGIMAERLLRRLRYMLMERTLRFPLPQFQKTAPGEVVTMVTAEVEPLGGFFGDAFVLVAFQGGTFLTIILFMFMQSPLIGFAALALVPLQGYIIPRLQKKINQLQKKRTQKVRLLSNQVGETVSNIQEIRAQNQNTRVMATLSQQLGQIFWIRLEIYKRKFFMKFVNNFITQLTPLLFYSIGGLLAITGHLSIGALVAALAAYKDMSASWKELLGYYNRMSDARIKYDQLTGQFAPQGMLDEALFADGKHSATPEQLTLTGSIRATGLTWADEDGFKALDGASFQLTQGTTTVILSNNGISRTVLAQLLSRVLLPSEGKLLVGENDMETLPASLVGRRIGLLTSEPAIFNCSILDNLLLGLQNYPPPETENREDTGHPIQPDEKSAEKIESLASGNSPHDPGLNWINYTDAQVADQEELLEQIMLLLQQVELDEDMYQLGLNQLIDKDTHPEIAEQILIARSKVHEKLAEQDMDDMVQSYNFNQYNTYTSVATNILCGQPVDDRFSADNLAHHPLILELLDSHQLTETFYDIGLQAAELMLDLFSDIPEGHPIFDQYRFIDDDKLPVIRKVVQRAKQKAKGEISSKILPPEDYQLLLGITFHLNAEQHRLGLIDRPLQQKLIKLRKSLRRSHPEIFADDGAVKPYETTKYNPGLSILDNILFGRIAEKRSGAKQRVYAVIKNLIDTLDMRHPIMQIALGSGAGINGSRLSGTQKQKLSLARTLLKKPDILIANEPMSLLSAEQSQQITHNIRQLLPETTQIWLADSVIPAGMHFDQILTLESGRIKPVETPGKPGQPAEAMADSATATRQEADTHTETDNTLINEVRTLQELPLFANLDTSLLKLLAFTSQRTHYLPGEMLMQQGEEGETAHIILSGQVEVFIDTPDGEEILTVLGKNKLIGELALICATQRTASIRATKDTVTLQINRETFGEIVHQDDNFSYQLIRQLGQRLIHTTEELNKHSGG